jgi:GNAT superfamily N-acetyltransferase
LFICFLCFLRMASVASSAATASEAATDAPLTLFITTLSKDGVIDGRPPLGNSAEALLVAAEEVMRLLAPGMPETTGAYVAQVQRTLASEPLRILFAVRHDDDANRVLGALVLRQYENTFNGTKMHVEGMLVDPLFRSRGVGRALVNAAKRVALAAGAADLVMQVDSQNPAALRFFARERLDINCLAFRGPAATPLRGKATVGQAPNPSPSPSLSPSPTPSPSADDGSLSPLAVQPSPDTINDQVIIVPPSSSSSAAAAAASSVVVSSSSSSSASIPVGTTQTVHAGFTVLEITDPAARVIRPEYAHLLRAGERVHRQLRLKMEAGTDTYEKRMRRVVADGAQVLVAVARTLVTDVPAAVAAGSASFAAAKDDEASAPIVLGVCVHRFYRDLTLGGGQLRNWVDDLVSDASHRSQGVGAAMLDLVNLQCRARGVRDAQLDSGCQRLRAHAFYFRSNMHVDALSLIGPASSLLPEIANVLLQPAA